ncbi:MAG: hypothetical protein CO093_05670 [Alphaproteobacteria bacterium CG_4_9_14_3_um_filter_47_13]|nr:MAG: hypothetical protein CO093_05670 [Alphaproteobacteria bacterium CG_4_9_14_3_um_filter_47_13]
MPTDKNPLELDDIYKTPVGDLFVLSEKELDALISDAEEAIRKCCLIKKWLNGAKRQNARRVR